MTLTYYFALIRNRPEYNLGLMYFLGEGVSQDDAEDDAWYRRAAEQGHADAQPMLGYMYFFGDGVPQDDAEAAAWFRKAAERGNADAQFRLGSMYYNSLGLPQDYVNAHVWFNLASEQGHEESRAFLYILEEEMTPDQIAEAQKFSRELDAETRER